MLPGKQFTPEDIVAIIWRRRWYIIVPFVVLTCATLAVSRLLPNRYRSETVVLIVPQRVPESYVRSTVTTRIEDRVQSIREQILSRTRLERIIDELQLYREERQLRPMEDIIESMRESVGTRIVRDDAFSVSFVASDALTAQRVAERLASLFSEENMRDREIQAESTNQFLQTQLENARQQLIAHEKRVEEFRLRHAGQLPDQVNANLQAIQNAELQLQALNESLNRDRDRRLFVERQIADASNPEMPLAPVPGQPVPAQQGPTPAQQLEQAEAAVRGLENRLTAAHPDLIAARANLARLRKQVESAPPPASAGPTGPSPAELLRRTRLRDLQSELAALDRQLLQKQADEQRLRGVIGTYRARVEAAPTREAEMIALTRDYETLQRQYRGLLEKYEDSKVAANLERVQIGEQFRILDPARVPARPFTPNRLVINAAGAAAGLGLGLLLVGLLEYRDRAFRAPQDVTAVLALPVFAAFPSIVNAAEQQRLTRRRRWMYAAGAGAVVLAAGLGVFWKLVLS